MPNSPSPDAALIRLLEAYEDVQDTEHARIECEKILNVLGLKHFAYGVLNLPSETNNDRALIVNTYSNEWKKFYYERSYIDIDPIVKVASSGITPVDWRSIDKTSTAVRDFFHNARIFGVGLQGLTLPIRGRLGEVAAFSVTSDMSDQEWNSFIASNMTHLILISWNFHNCVLRVIGAASKNKISISHREATCLRLKALGKTDGEVAEILGITKRTVSFHIESARSRLNAVNAVHAVAKALSLGLISVAHEPEL